MKRRWFIGGGAALVGLAITPIALGGTVSFLRRTLSDHFGPNILNIDGIDGFVKDYATLAGQGSTVKKLGAEVYFAWRGDKVHMIGQAEDLQERFLNTILTRSNIIAIQQGRETAFDYGDPDPWSPICGIYLSALAEETA
ncbi:hypothetical protein [Actibacterium sp. 188UL27-1]|uniref:hypothetical protein n=1 Tax=Actibacterium sp. 188UL27-1 TaxID=2786961 RepID=UPI001957D87D|nr:hypothetical protein [Actibacterium sp. 188UL27-1]MBM7069097.1 hypothetical protein [Actibacterium sp. 188UL27-1]